MIDSKPSTSWPDYKFNNQGSEQMVSIHSAPAPFCSKITFRFLGEQHNKSTACHKRLASFFLFFPMPHITSPS